jgi:hypothetical protein
MDLNIQIVDLNNFVRNGTLFISLASLIIHKDKLLLKAPEALDYIFTIC